MSVLKTTKVVVPLKINTITLSAYKKKVVLFGLLVMASMMPLYLHVQMFQLQWFGERHFGC